MGVRARDIVRAARKNHMKIRFGDYDHCALGTMAKLKGLPTPSNFDSLSINVVGEAYGLTPLQTRSLEAGFEGSRRGLYGNKPHKVYFRVGQNIARLAGLTSS